MRIGIEKINDWWLTIFEYWSWEGFRFSLFQVGKGFRFILFQVIGSCSQRRFMRQRDKSADENKKGGENKWLMIFDGWFLKLGRFQVFFVSGWERFQVYFVSGYRFVFAETLHASAWQKHWWKKERWGKLMIDEIWWFDCFKLQRRFMLQRDKSADEKGIEKIND